MFCIQSLVPESIVHAPEGPSPRVRAGVARNHFRDLIRQLIRQVIDERPPNPLAVLSKAAASPASLDDSDSLALCGRGLKMIRLYTDAFHYNEQGNAITMTRIHRRGDDATGAHRS